MHILNTCDAHLSWMDFNDADEQLVKERPCDRKQEKKEIEQALYRKLDQALFYLFPNGETTRHEFLMGNVRGDEGESLKVELEGEKAGQWFDFATGEGGDIFDLWGIAKGWNARTQFPQIMDDIQKWLGLSVSHTQPRKEKKKKGDDLGTPTGKWDYRDREGQVIACVYRYDTPKGKEFRPWDAKTHKYQAPDPRPLYNQPGMVHARNIILVEGEKCAEVLIQKGFCAATAMGGANAPLDKTDWSPLKGKNVLIWSDHDAPGKDYGDRLVAYLREYPVLSLSRLEIPDDLPDKWDAADAVQEGRDIQAFIQQQLREIALAEEDDLWDEVPVLGMSKIPSFTLKQYYHATDPIPEDLILPRILTPGGLLVFGGAPKIGKTDFLLHWLVHMAAGSSFMGMRSPRPLKIFYLQTEIGKPYLQERIQHLPIREEIVTRAFENLIITPQIRFFLDEDGVELAHQTIRGFFKPDVIVIDPLRNVFDGKSENDNMEMLAFLQDRIEALRLMTNPSCGMILVHHTRKIGKTELADDPFQALSGASCLRSFYTTGMILSRPDEKKSMRHLVFELRCGKPIASKHVDKVDGLWREMNVSHARTVRQEFGEKCDEERTRIKDVIVTLIAEAAKRGELYTPSQFSQVFENKAGLGGEVSIRRRIHVLASNGHIKFNRDSAILNDLNSKYGIMCVEGMSYREREDVDEETGEVTPVYKTLLPTHFKEHKQGAILPVENPEVWVYV